ncbi:hypothetical protein [uncultured Campylobacter sp.]|uniref:hypothetical protein n=1 Tax=uncultured Campylobacter sp. TaxID=218934 RepID=UPI0025DCF672|nr:hypothetical protein [uncultured Campylobacter sp.]
MTQNNKESPFYLSDEDAEFLMDLGKEMLKQDTRSTAQPYGLTVQKKETIITDEEFADNWTLFSEGDAVAEGLKRAKAYLIDEIHENLIDADSDAQKLELVKELGILLNVDDDDGLQSYIRDRKELNDYSYYPTMQRWIADERMVFTFSDREAREYAERGENYRTYGVYLGRSPIMSRLCEILLKIGEQARG